jgi:serine/threonine-protein kinase
VVEASRLLAERGLTLGQQTEQAVTDGAQVGKIVSSTPAAGENTPGGSQVAVVVGKQQATVAVPDVTGQSADDAEKDLRQAGFAVKRASVDGGGSEGDVVGTDPAAGTQAPQGSTVTMRVSTGDGNDLKMPDVTGDKVRDAQRKLVQEGVGDIAVQTRPTDNEDQDGRVLGQSPSSGSRISKEQQVVLVVGQFTGSTSDSGQNGGG